MSSPAPPLRPRPLAADGTLAAGLTTGEPGALALLPEGRMAPGEEAGDAAALPKLPDGRLPFEALGASSELARQRAREVLEGKGVFVTTGQQPLLFLGPLLVLYKAITAVATAEALSEAGTPAVALFWVAGDDHDWDEVGRTRTLDLSNRLREARLGPPGERAGRAVGPTALPEEVGDHLDEFFQHLPESEFIGHYLELFRDAWAPGRTFSEAFGLTLEGCLEGLDLVRVDAADPAVRRAQAPLFRRVLEEADAVEAALARGTEAVRSAGWCPQLDREAGALPLFLDTPGGRHRVYREGGGYRSGRDGPRLDASELLDLLEDEPGRFSPDVALRPVSASWLLPTGVTVLGPSELSYWAQLPDLFRWAEVPIPRLRPRDAWTVLEDKITKVLVKVDARPGDFRDGGRSLAERVNREGRPEAVDRALDEARAGVGRALARVEEAVEETLPGIRSAVGAARHQAFEVLGELEAAVDDRVEEQHEVVLGQIRKAATHLWPDGRPQERVLSPLYYLARYGHGFVRRIVDRARARFGAGEEG